MADQLRAGTIYLKTNGVILEAKGDFDYDLGAPKRDAIVGQGAIHGFMEKTKVPFIEGTITDSSGLDVKALFTAKNLTVTLELANGKTVVLSDAWYAGDGTANTGEAEIKVRWEGKGAEEV